MCKKDLTNHSGKISYKDFSKWVGNYIHSVQGFYFRHDSIKNPPYEKNLVTYSDKVGRFSDNIAKEIIPQADVKNVVFNKIQSQWKTIKKSFADIGKDNSGTIDKYELKVIFNNWGIHINDETFN